MLSVRRRISPSLAQRPANGFEFANCRIDKLDRKTFCRSYGAIARDRPTAIGVDRDTGPSFRKRRRAASPMEPGSAQGAFGGGGAAFEDMMSRAKLEGLRLIRAQQETAVNQFYRLECHGGG